MIDQRPAGESVPKIAKNDLNNNNINNQKYSINNYNQYLNPPFASNNNLGKNESTDISESGFFAKLPIILLIMLIITVAFVVVVNVYRNKSNKEYFDVESGNKEENDDTIYIQ